jgi:hypothetical protein
MAYTPITAWETKQSAAGGNFTSDAIDTTGADLIVILVADYAGIAATTVTDSLSNGAPTQAAVEDAGGSDRIRILYWEAPANVGSGHTFSISAGSNSFGALAVRAYSGSLSPTVLDQASQAEGGTPGTLTPSVNNCLVISGCVHQQASVTVSGATEVVDLAIIGGVAFGIGVSEDIQTTATAANPTWSSVDASVQAVFLPGGGGGGGGGGGPIEIRFSEGHRPAPFKPGVRAPFQVGWKKG